MAIERDTDDTVTTTTTGRRWQPFAPGIEVYTRDPAPPPGEPFTGNYEGSAFAEGRWRIYVGDGPDPAAEGWCGGRDEEARMREARRAVERWWGAAGAVPAAPDLDAWRADAGAALALAEAAPIGPWEFGQREGGLGRRWVTTQNPNHCIIQLPEGAGPFIAAARTGWPRDAARVGVLCDEVERLRAAVLDACNGWDGARKSATPGRRADAEAIARLRALAAGTAREEPTK